MKMMKSILFFTFASSLLLLTACQNTLLSQPNQTESILLIKDPRPQLIVTASSQETHQGLNSNTLKLFVGDLYIGDVPTILNSNRPIRLLPGKTTITIKDEYQIIYVKELVLNEDTTYEIKI